MKRLVRFFAVCVMICSILCTGATGSEILHEKYGFQENFEYGDEFIGHALKTSVVYVGLNYEATVKYKPVVFNEEGVGEFFAAAYEEFGDEYTEEEIAQAILEDIESDILSYLQWGNTKRIDVSLSAHGSGVVISEDGHIATNAHVVTLSDKDKEQACVEYLQVNIQEDIVGILSYLEDEYGITIGEEDADELYQVVLDETADSYDISNVDEELFVAFPGESGDTDYDEDRAYEAEIVEVGVPVSLGEEGATQDAAILKIDEENLVALKLSDSYPESNTQIVTAGFPAAAETIFQQLGSGNSLLSASIDTGKVSRQISIKGHDYKAMEITTTISGGNSGGPSVDSRLDIEGLNTYTLASDARYAYMIPAEYVADLVGDIELVRGDVSKNFLTGIQMLQQGYGSAAKECFEAVKDARPETPYIENLIALAEKAPQEYPSSEEEKQSFLERMAADQEFANQVYIIAGASVVGMVLIVVLIIIIVKVVKKKRRKRAFEEAMATAPESETEVFCSHCGEKTDDDSEFCSSCGKEL